LPKSCWPMTTILTDESCLVQEFKAQGRSLTRPALARQLCAQIAQTRPAQNV